jgi:fructose-1,6-bisphosphatase I
MDWTLVVFVLLLLIFENTTVGFQHWTAGAVTQKFSRTSLAACTSKTTTGGSMATLSGACTLGQFLSTESWKLPEFDGLADVLRCIEGACRDIKHLTRRVLIDNLDGLHREEQGEFAVNVQGEAQRSLDVVANRIMRNALCSSGNVAAFLSEEEELPCLCSNILRASHSNPPGEYTVVFDPLDGSSNIESGLSMGTICGIYKNTPEADMDDAAGLCSRTGDELVAAGYCLYAAATHLVLTLRRGVHLFTLDDLRGQFCLTRSNLQVPSAGSICAFNTAHSATWGAEIRRFVDDMQSNCLIGVSIDQPKSRYIGALVADAHNVLLHGGVFGYPATAARPRGKLRQQYEANPLALLMEEAGGLAVLNKQ